MTKCCNVDMEWILPYLYRVTNFGGLHVRSGPVAVGDFIGNFRERDIDFGEGVGI